MIALLIHFLLASVAFAIPASELGGQSSSPHADSQFNPIDLIEVSAVSARGNTVYVSDSAGAAYINEPPGTFNIITGTITIPTVTGPNGGAIVGVLVDGVTCKTSSHFAGILLQIVEGEASYAACHGPPPPSHLAFLDNFEVRKGDVIKIIIHVFNKNSIRVIFENHTSGNTVKLYPPTSGDLCMRDAGWIVEPYRPVFVSLVDFVQITFTNATAYNFNGFQYTPADAVILDIAQNDRFLTSVSTSGDTLTIQYE